MLTEVKERGVPISSSDTRLRADLLIDFGTEKRNGCSYFIYPDNLDI